MLFNLYYYNTVLRHKELHISHKQYKKRGYKYEISKNIFLMDSETEKTVYIDTDLTSVN